MERLYNKLMWVVCICIILTLLYIPATKVFDKITENQEITNTSDGNEYRIENNNNVADGIGLMIGFFAALDAIARILTSPFIAFILMIGMILLYISLLLNKSSSKIKHFIGTIMFYLYEILVIFSYSMLDQDERLDKYIYIFLFIYSLGLYYIKIIPERNKAQLSNENNIDNKE